LDTLTHALSGALLARATASKADPRRIAAGFFVCAAPDLDFVASFAGPLAYLENHRGVTHSLILLPVWALGLSWLLAKIVREPDGKEAGWRALYGITAMAIGLHIAGDLITSYGTMILAPFSNWRAGIGTTFIIDLWFSGIIVLGLIASAVLWRSRWPAIAAFAVLVGYVGFQFVQREHALEFAQRHAWPGSSVDVQPRPVSAFNWTVFISDDEKHEFAHINLRRTEPHPYTPGDGFIARVDAPYMPLNQAIWVRRTRYGDVDAARGREAWNSAVMAPLRWFMELPAFDSSNERCVWFVDLRFLTPGREGTPFRYGACREGADWRLAPPG
jgi:inner membrane protein